jgi:hypothetical protein
MTETLHRPTINPEHESSAFEIDELEAKLSLEYDHDDESDMDTVEHQPTEISPMATRIRKAAERFANRLERRAINRAHDEALDFMRKTDNADYVDHVAELAENGDTEKIRNANRNLLNKEYSRADREASLEAGKQKLQYLGALATATVIESSKIVSEATKSAGEVVSETTKGVGTVIKSEAQYKINDLRLKHSNDRLTKQFHRNYEKETKRFDKQAEKASRKLEKSNQKDIKRAVKEDERFERSMRNKERVEKVMNTVERGAARVVYTKRRLGAAAVGLRNIGQGRTEYVPRAKRSVK